MCVLLFSSLQVCARCKGCRVATLFCPPVEEPRREAGPAAMGHPPWGSKHGLYVVVVNAGGAPKGRERSNPRRYMGLEVHD